MLPRRDVPSWPTTADLGAAAGLVSYLGTPDVLPTWSREQPCPGDDLPLIQFRNRISLDRSLGVQSPP
jgi:hypothetical protein